MADSIDHFGARNALKITKAQGRESDKVKPLTASERTLQEADKKIKDLQTLILASMRDKNPFSQKDPGDITQHWVSLMSIREAVGQSIALEDIKASLNGPTAYSHLIGNDVKIKGDSVIMKNGEAEMFFDLSSGIKEAKLEIIDKSGHVIDTIKVGASQNQVVWPGQAGRDAAFYRDLKFRVVTEAGEDEAKSAADNLWHYATISEIAIEKLGNKSQVSLITESGQKVSTEDMSSIRAGIAHKTNIAHPSIQSSLLNTLLERHDTIAVSDA